MNQEPLYTKQTIDHSPLCGEPHGFAELLTWSDAIDLERWYNTRTWNWDLASP